MIAARAARPLRFIRPLLSQALAVAALAAATACAAERPRLPLWVIEGERNSIYLLGSIHVLRASDYPLPEAMQRAYEDAEVLYMEVDLDDLDPGAAVAFTLGNGMLPADRSLADVLGVERFAAAQARAKAIGIDLGFFSRFEPWVVALGVVQAQFARLGLDPEQGVEKHFARLAGRDGKEIRGLETLADQLGALDGLALERQAQFLMLSLEDAGTMDEDLDTLMRAWKSGDAGTLGRTLAEEFEDFPDLYAPLIVSRNASWAAQIRALLEDDNDYLVVVGALHLVGEDSVLELLRARGLRARQL